MKDYILKRLLLMIPTLFGITLMTFFVIQLAPGSLVIDKIVKRLPITLILNALSVFLVYLIAIPIGTCVAVEFCGVCYDFRSFSSLLDSEFLDGGDADLFLRLRGGALHIFPLYGLHSKGCV